jgi:hypothetical protein
LPPWERLLVTADMAGLMRTRVLLDGEVTGAATFAALVAPLPPGTYYIPQTAHTWTDYPASMTLAHSFFEVFGDVANYRIVTVTTSVGNGGVPQKRFMRTMGSNNAWAVSAWQVLLTDSDANTLYAAKPSADYAMGNSSGGWTAMTTAQQNALNSGVVAADKTYLDFNGVNSAPGTFNNLNITKCVSMFPTSVNQSLGITSVAVNNAAFMIVVTASANIVITLPASNATYVNNFGANTFNIAAGKTSIIHGIKISSDNKIYFNVEEGK